MLKEKYNGEKTSVFLTDCARLEAGEPLAYVIGWVSFLDTKIWLDSKPLIPRSETEYWVGNAIAEIMKREKPKVLDLCAGSGCVGVAVAKAIPQARVDFVEIDTGHHANIVRNICDNGIDYTQTRVFGGDLFTEIPTGTVYDAIFTNPPYIDPALDRTDTNVKNHEPHLALYGGKNGTKIIEHILHEVPHYLAPKGQLWLEHEPEQVVLINKIASSLPYSSIQNLPDQFGTVRYSRLTRGENV